MRRALYACLALSFVAGTVMLFWSPTERLPDLDAGALAAARAAWDAAGPKDYVLELAKELDARAPEIIRTRVEGGRAVELTLDGRPAPPNDAYGVPGLFALAERELEMAGSGRGGPAPEGDARSRPQERPPGQPRSARLKGLFHPESGLPLVLKRIAPERMSFVLKVRRLETPEGRLLWERSP